MAKNQFVCRFRMFQCNSSKAAYSIRQEDGTYRTEMRHSCQVAMTGVKDDIFGPATPSATVSMTIANSAVETMLREAFKQYYLDHKGEGNDQSYGVEIEAVFTVRGASPADVYP